MARVTPKDIRIFAPGISLDIDRDNRGPFDIIKAQSQGFEVAYCAQVSRAHRSQYGQFFTPSHTAQLMADWISEICPETVLDPAVGPGLLLDSVARNCPTTSLTGYDLDPLCIQYAEARLSTLDYTLHTADFLTTDVSQRFDGIIANPPYLRHHELSYDFDIFTQYSKAYGLTLSKLSNAYILFLIKGLSLLNSGGRASYIIPAEWSNANFGAPIKAFFSRMRILREVIYFNHDGVVFDDNLSTGCVLLVENAPSDQPVRTHYVPANFCATNLDSLRRDPSNLQSSFSVEELSTFKKWDFVISRGRQERLPGLVSLRELANTRRGIATGANSFFHVSDAVVQEYHISEHHTKPCMGKAKSAKSFLFSKDDWVRLKASAQPSTLLDFTHTLSEGERRYVDKGTAEGIHERYLTKARNPWYSMERQKPAPIWAAVFGREGMRFIVNEANILTLTTFHCVYPDVEEPTYVKALAACLNSKGLQDRARSKVRVYGAGLLKYEPKDLLEIEVPDLRQVSTVTLQRLADMFDELDRSTRSDVITFDWESLDVLVVEASEEAASNRLL